MTASISTLFRDELLAGQAIALAGGGGALAQPLRALGAEVTAIELEPAGEEEEAAERAVASAHAAAGRIDTLVLDARAYVEVPHVLDATWIVVRAVATAAMIPDERGGKIVLVAAPPPAEPARAGLENMARTLSIEWARFGIRPTVRAPGKGTTEEEIGALLAYLASPAGDYFSGSRLSLGEVTVR